MLLSVEPPEWSSDCGSAFRASSPLPGPGATFSHGRKVLRSLSVTELTSLLPVSGLLRTLIIFPQGSACGNVAIA